MAVVHLQVHLGKSAEQMLCSAKNMPEENWKKYSLFAEQMINAEQSGDELQFGTQKPRTLPSWKCICALNQWHNLGSHS